ncbi:hypothetical protein RCL1_006884 [Eukaryota sp. TZLM3-RCL]
MPPSLRSRKRISSLASSVERVDTPVKINSRRKATPIIESSESDLDTDSSTSEDELHSNSDTSIDSVSSSDESPAAPSDTIHPLVHEAKTIIKASVIDRPSSDFSSHFLGRIVLQGFKSYSHDAPQAITFSPDLNCICGVNGSGKSNIIEALCFICGYRSTDLRSSSLNELSHHGDSREVVVVVEFWKRDDLVPSFAVGRKILNGSSSFVCCEVVREGQMDYSLIKSVSKSKAQEMLQRVGLDLTVPERWICRQLNTLNLVRHSPLGFLHQLETIAGISSLHAKHDEIKKVAVEMEEQISVLKTKHENLGQFCQDLQSNYDAYQELCQVKDEVNALTTLQHKCQYDYCKLELQSINSQIATIDDKEKSLIACISALSSDKANHLSKIDRLKSDEANQNDLRDQITTTSNHLSNEQGTISAKITELEIELKSILNQRKSYKRQLKSLYENKQKLEQECQENSEEVAIMIENEELLKQQISELSQTISKIESKYSQHELSKFKEARQAQIYKETVDRDRKQYEIFLNSVVEQDQKCCKEIRTFTANRKELLQTLKSLHNEKENSYSNLNKKQQIIANLESSKQEVIKKIVSTENFIANLKDELSSLQTNANSQGELNFLVRSYIETNGPSCGVIGTVPQLIVVKDKKYLLPANRSLSYTLRSTTVLVTCRDVALNFINYAKTQSRYLRNINCEIATNNYSSYKSSGIIKLADVLEANKFLDENSAIMVRNFINRIGSNTLICNSVSDALKLTKTHSSCVVVTLTGIVYSPNGEVSKSDVRGTSLVLHNESPTNSTVSVKILAEEKNLKEVELSDLRRELDAITKQLDVLQTGILPLQQENNRVDSEITTVTDSIKQVDQALKILSKRTVALGNEKERLTKLINSLIIEDISPEILESCEEWNELQELKGRKKAELDRIQAQISKLGTCIQNSESKLKSIDDSHSTINERITYFANQSTNLKRKIQDFNDDLSIIVTRLEETNSELQNKSSKLKGLRKKLMDLDTKIHEIDCDIDNYSHQLNEIHVKKNCLVQERENLEAEISRLEKLLVDVPLELSNHHKSFNRLKKQKDFKEKAKEFITNVNEKVQSLIKRIKDLEPQVSMEKVQQYITAEQETQEIELELQKLTTTTHRFSEILCEIIDKRYELVSQIITLLNRYLNRIFPALTNGGALRLDMSPNREVLENIGVIINVKMPSDTWADFSRLSGGQQALSVLGITLSLFLAFPTPVVVADEVDAALDIVAVGRLANILKKISKADERQQRQIILVSLRREMYESCNRIVGVYQFLNSSRLIAMNFEQEQEEIKIN